LYKIKISFFLKTHILIFVFLIGLNASANNFKKIDSLKANLIFTDSQTNIKDLHLKIGDAYYENSCNVEAMDYYKKALDESKAEGDFNSVALSYMKIGKIYMELGSFDLALDNFLKAREISANRNPNLTAEIDINMGVLLEQTGSFNEALNYLIRSAEYYKSPASYDLEKLLQSYSSIGVVYGRKEGAKSLDSALLYFNQALNLAQNNNLDIDQGAILNNIGAIYYKMEETDSALYYYETSLELFDKINSAKGVAIAKLNIAQILTSEKKYENAEDFFLESMKILESTGALFYLKDLYLNYTDLLKEQKRFEEAFNYAILYSELKDSIQNKELITKINAVESRNIIEKKERELKNVTREKELIDAKRKMTIISLISFIIAAVFVVISQFSKIKNTKLKNQLLEKELDYKKRDLENLALHIVQKNEFFSDIRKEFRKIKLPAEDINKSKIKNINSRISQYFRINQDQKKFMTYIHEVNQSYFAVLEDKYPNLTSKEKQLCAFINLNLSSKDIAVINNVSERAVIMARYRMRKKLGIPKEIGIKDFLQNSEK